MTHNGFQDIVIPATGGSSHGSFGGSGGKLEDLSNVRRRVPGTNPGRRESLTFNGADNTWENDELYPFINKWSSKVEYRTGDIVEYNSAIWVSVIDSLNKNPGTSHAEWKNLSGEPIKEWKPGKDWSKGDIVSVAWDRNFLRAGRTYSADLKERSLWYCTVDMKGNTPVAHGEPCSISEVPPGQWVRQDYTPEPIGSSGLSGGGLKRRGTQLTVAEWVPITAKTLHVYDNYQDMLQMEGPLIPGDQAITKNNGFIYRWSNSGHTESFGWEEAGTLRLRSTHSLDFDFGSGDYDWGALAIFNEKLYECVPSTKYPRPILSPGANAVRPFKGTLAEFVDQHPVLASYTNKGTTPEALPLPLAGDLQPGQTLVSIGVGTNTNDMHIDGFTWSSGFQVYTNAVTNLDLTEAGIADVLAEWEIKAKPASRESPLTNPDKWKLIVDFTVAKSWLEVKKYIDDQVAPLVFGIEHGSPIGAILNTPKGTEPDGTLVLVGTAPTGDFAKHPNEIAFRENGKWVFTKPTANEAHANDDDNNIYHWSGTQWNSVGSVGMKYEQITAAAYAALGTKDPKTLYLVTK